jgi:hypothetical protein
VGKDASGQPSAQKTQEQPKPDNTPLTLEAIQREIARVAGAIEAQKDDEEAKRKEAREISDVEAQEAMARWAENLFLTTLATIILTAVGVFLIWRTLIHTRVAAVAARDMVEKARKTTVAAVQANAEAKRHADLAEQSFARLERPYIYIYGVSRFEHDFESATNCVKYTVANFGKTPATITIMAAGISTFHDGPTDPLIVDYRDDPGHDIISRPVLPPGDVREGIRVDTPHGVEMSGLIQSASGAIEGWQNLSPKLAAGEYAFVWIRLQYRGPFGDGYMTGACWRYDKQTNRLVQWGDERYNYMS